jgi:hypothetical protein
MEWKAHHGATFEGCPMHIMFGSKSIVFFIFQSNCNSIVRLQGFLEREVAIFKATQLCPSQAAFQCQGAPDAWLSRYGSFTMGATGGHVTCVVECRMIEYQQAWDPEHHMPSENPVL